MTDQPDNTPPPDVDVDVETTTDSDDGPFVRPFLDVLRELEKGRLADELSEKLPQVVAAVKDTGKPGALTLTIRVKPYNKDDDILIVDSTVTAKVPQPDRKPSLMYADGDANLVRSDPNQPMLPGVGTGGPKVIQGGKSRTGSAG